MAYTPVDPLTLTPGLLGTATVYQTIAENHNELWTRTDVGVFETLFTTSISAGLTDSQILAWRVRGNRDLQPIVVRVYASSSPTSSTVTVRIGGSWGTATVTGAAAWYTITVTPAVSGPTACAMLVTTPGGETLTITRVQCYVNAANTNPAGTLSSGFTRVDSATFYATSEPVCSEHAARLLGGPVYIARDRPRCVASHLSRTHTQGGSKSIAYWEAVNTTTAELVGKLYLPLVSRQPRRYIFDAFTLESASGGTASIVVDGAEVLAIGNMGGTAGTWSSAEVELPAGAHIIKVSITPGTTSANIARVATLQVWRALGSYTSNRR